MTRHALCLTFLAACAYDDSEPPQPEPPDPTAPGTITITARTSGTEAGTITLTATRTGGSGGAVGVGFATGDDTAIAAQDYVATAGTISWADGDAGDKTVTLQLVDDQAIEGEEGFEVTFADPTGGATLATPRLWLPITDDDRLGMVHVLTATRIVTFEGGAAVSAATLTGVPAGESLVGLDVRPVDRMAIALSTAGKLYTIDPASGAVTAKSTLVADASDTTAPFTGLSGTAFGIDFNPVVDRLRIVSDTGQNLRVNIDTGAVVTDTDLTGAATGYADAAYINSFAAACRTTLYGLDATADRLLLQSPPNDGALVAAGALGVDATAIRGFDVATDTAARSAAYALLDVGGTTGLYAIDLASGAATPSGTLAAGETPIDLAFDVPTTAVTQPPGELFAYTEGGKLVSFTRAAPAKLCTSAAITGIPAANTIVGVDFRPSTGALHALTNNAGAGTLYTLDRATGAASSPVAIAVPLVGTRFGMDFNPTGPVALRIVSDTGQNVRVTDPTTGAAIQDGPLGGAGSAASGAAYTDSLAGAGTTTLYVLDTAADRLRIQNPPNAGTLVDVGEFGVDLDDRSAFDIDGRDNTAFVTANLATGTGTTLHLASLATGMLSASLGTIGGGERILGITRPPPSTAIYGLTDGDVLVRLSLADPMMTTTIGPVTNLAANEQLIGIDFRPSTGILYGVGSLGGTYQIDRDTAAGTRLATLTADPADLTAPFAAFGGTAFGLDFNPTGPVALRLVSDAEENLRIPNITAATGFTVTDGALTGSPTPDAVAAAYTNSYPGSLATQLFVLDAASGQLLLQSPPNDGILTPIGALSPGLTFANAAFDIAGGNNGISLAALQRTGELASRLYRVNLTTGVATEIGTGIGGAPLRGLAIRTAP